MPDSVKTRLEKLQETKDWLAKLRDYRDDPITQMIVETMDAVKKDILDSILSKEIPGEDNNVKMNFILERRGQAKGIDQFKQLLDGEISSVEQIINNLVEEANASRARTLSPTDYTKGGHSENY